MIEAEKVHSADRDFPWTVWRMRVPGGWLYHFVGANTVFVPEETIVQDTAEVVSPVNFTPLSSKK